MKRYLFLGIIFFLISCKSKTVLVDVATKNGISSEEIIKNYSNNKLDFSTLYIKANAQYKDKNQSQNVSAEIKIKRDEKILISIRFLGITMAKALITPESVQYYEKINGKYFEGNYEMLSQWLGTDLDFKKVQNMLLGQTIDSLQHTKYKESQIDKLYKLEDITDAKTQKIFFFEAEQFRLKRQEIIQFQQERKIQINYPEYQKQNEMSFPSNMNIEATQNNETTTIDINYKNISVNEEFSFPYSVPEGYERVLIN